MKAILANVPRRRSIGLHVGEREIALSRIAFTPLGPVVVDRQVEPRASESPTPIIQRLLEPLRTSRAWRRAPIAVGMPGMGVFFSTRPVQIQRNTEDQSPQVLLHEILQSANLNIDHMQVDAVRWQLGRRSLASLAACRKKALSPILEALEQCEVRPYQVEPAPCALLRVAVERYRTPRRCPVALRVFLGHEHAMAIVTADDTPLMWRYFPLEAGSEGMAILSMHRFVSSNYRVYGADTPPAALIIHGRPDLDTLAELSHGSGVPIRVLRYPGPAYEAGEIATGLALGCLPHLSTFNLARDLRPPEPIFSLLPWGQMAVQASVLALATFLMIEHRRSLDREFIAVRAEQSQYPWLQSLDLPKLRQERDDLMQRTSSIERYLSSRILWTECEREIADLLPDGMVVTKFDGQATYEVVGGKGRKTAPKRSLTLAIDAPIPSGRAVSPEVEVLIEALRESPLLQKTLPDVDMAGLRWNSGGPSRTPTASFVVHCQPGATSSKPSRETSR
ncbi:hypothetical protein [Tautonia rosea]|uniref:hypothetical protein n=1 Tax=Tautonia rosea TaxID=2728037 RepID=UPI001476059D|nr:hypothetical protein [Tautonia rosea]